MSNLETLSADVVDAALHLHRELGPGMRQSVYVGIKSVERLTGAHAKQGLTYLRLMNQPMGLLINCGGETLKEGLRRIVNDHRPSAPPREPNIGE